MKKFIGVLICFIILVVAGAAYATNSGIYTQQDKARTLCDIGVPCVFQVADYQFTAIATTDFVIPNVRDVANMKAPLYLISTDNPRQKVIYRQLNKSFRVTPVSLPVASEKIVIKQNRLHFDPGNC